MKKRILSVIVCFAVVFSTFFAASLTVEALSFDDVQFYIEKNEAAGLSKKKELAVRTTVSNGSTSYNVGIHFDKNVTLSSLKLSWTNSGSVTVKSGTRTCTSGSTSIPSDGDLTGITLKLTVSGKTRSIKFNTVIVNASETVKPLYLYVDETHTDDSCGEGETCTIDRMNGDVTYHEYTCYGTVSDGGKSYFMSMKGRGNYTWKWAKKPYNMTIFEDDTYDGKKKAELIPGLKSKKWSLLANYADSTLLRNKLGYDLAYKMGIGLQSRFVDLWLNGEYLGNYLLTPKTDYSAPDYGYILELDNKQEKAQTPARPDFEPDVQFTYRDKIREKTDSYNAFTIKDKGVQKGVLNEKGKEKVDIEDQTIIDDTKKAIDAIWDSSEDYLNYIDLDSWAKMYLLQELIKNYDIISGSIFMYRNGTTSEDKLFAGPLWDLDNSMGHLLSVCSYSSLSETMQRSADGWYIDSINPSQVDSIFQYLGKHASFMKRVYEIYNEYKKDFDSLTDEITTLSEEIKTSRENNFKRWNINQRDYNNSYCSSKKTYSSGTYQTVYIATSTYNNYITNLKTYISLRTKYFSDKLLVTAPSVTASGNTVLSVGDDMTLSLNGKASAYQWQCSADGETWTDISGETKTTYSVKATADMDGLYYRVKATNNGASAVSTSHVASVVSAACSYSALASAVHIHEFSDKYSSDGNYHWHECSCGEKADMAQHVYDNNCDTDCNICSAVRTAEPHQFGDDNICDICGYVLLVSGDANADGKVDINDCIFITLYVKNGGSLSEEQKAAADVTNDTKVDLDDAEKIARYIVNLIENL